MGTYEQSYESEAKMSKGHRNQAKVMKARRKAKERRRRKLVANLRRDLGVTIVDRFGPMLKNLTPEKLSDLVDSFRARGTKLRRSKKPRTRFVPRLTPVVKD